MIATSNTLEVPPGLEVKVDLEHLVLRTSLGTKSVVSFSKCCSKLTTFAYDQTIGHLSRNMELDGQLDIIRALKMSSQSLSVILMYTSPDETQVFKCPSLHCFPNLVRTSIAIRSILGYIDNDLDDLDFFMDPITFAEDGVPEHEHQIRQLNDYPAQYNICLHEMLPESLKTLEIQQFRFHPHYKQIYVLLEDVIRRGGRNEVPLLENIVLGLSLWFRACDRLVRCPELRSLLRAAEKKGVKIWKVTTEAMFDQEVTEELIPCQLEYPEGALPGPQFRGSPVSTIRPGRRALG